MSGSLSEAEELEATVAQCGLVCSFINPTPEEVFFIIGVCTNMLTTIQHTFALSIKVFISFFISCMCKWTYFSGCTHLYVCVCEDVYVCACSGWWLHVSLRTSMDYCSLKVENRRKNKMFMASQGILLV